MCLPSCAQDFEFDLALIEAWKSDTGHQPFPKRAEVRTERRIGDGGFPRPRRNDLSVDPNSKSFGGQCKVAKTGALWRQYLRGSAAIVTPAQFYATFDYEFLDERVCAARLRK